MNVQVTCYLDVTSSWCYWAEPAWRELKQRYAHSPVTFGWKIALLDESGMVKSRAQADWFYRRSGTIMRSPFMLNSGWLTGLKEYLAPNCVAEAARDFGVTDDRVRLALTEAALREGQNVGDWDVAVSVAAKTADLDSAALIKTARSSEIERRVRTTTAEFHALQVTQRPAFVLKSNIDDRAVFSGLVKSGPVAAAIDAMLDDASAYAAFAAHFGSPPPD
ncbi:MAG: DsbA family protein [Verrucomicrobiota bacterium]|nr:DsbA family protein [Verrucomicrobiota bacterium]